MWLNFSLKIAFQKEILSLLSLFVYLYGGLPFLKGMIEEIGVRKPGVMTLIGMVTSVAFFYSVATFFLLKGPRKRLVERYGCHTL